MVRELALLCYTGLEEKNKKRNWEMKRKVDCYRGLGFRMFKAKQLALLYVYIYIHTYPKPGSLNPLSLSLYIYVYI